MPQEQLGQEGRGPGADAPGREALEQESPGQDGAGRTGPLAGVVVADLSRVLAGPYATMLLADMGATVIKVESPRGDDTRAWSPPERDGESTYFLAANRNKRSIALDFADPEDRRVLDAIIARADILVENFRPGTLARHGLDYATLADRHPGLVYTSITGFGTGAGAGLPGYDLLAQAASGFMSVTGEAEGEPMRAGVALFDVVTGLHAAVGTLAAYLESRESGRGQHVEFDLLTSALSGLVNQASAFVAGGHVPHRMGNDHPSLFPYGPFAARDGRLVIAVGNDAQFRRLCTVLGLDAVAGDERFATSHARSVHREELRPLLAERLARRGAEEWFGALRAAQVPCAPILSIAGGVELAESLGLGPVVETGGAVPDDDGRRIPTIRNPATFSRTPVSHAGAPPRLDADRDAVLRWLGGDPLRA